MTADNVQFLNFRTEEKLGDCLPGTPGDEFFLRPEIHELARTAIVIEPRSGDRM
jgi:hypothetical protein